MSIHFAVPGWSIHIFKGGYHEELSQGVQGSIKLALFVVTGVAGDYFISNKLLAIHLRSMYHALYND